MRTAKVKKLLITAADFFWIKTILLQLKLPVVPPTIGSLIS
jgi:hypothetical protein